MNKKILIIAILIITGFILLLLGYYGGYYGGVLSETKKSAPQLETFAKLQNLIKSKVVKDSNIFAYGTVTAISSSRKITLTALTEKESLEVPIKEGAEIISFVVPAVAAGGSIVPVQQTITFDKIQVGDMASIVMKMKTDGGYEGVSLRVFPKPAAQ